ncbi:MAG: membrane protein insertion efficiency factor YidD [Rhodothermia bacterium]|nr:membrane protein insertion efficiency factor YidD [Rhodothermia bacterium]
MRVASALYRFPARVAIGLVRGYQAIVSPHMAPSCRFAPTCSEYAVQAFQKYGLLKGLVLSIHRVMRCHPWGGEGYDPPTWYGEEQTDARQQEISDGK